MIEQPRIRHESGEGSTGLAASSRLDSYGVFFLRANGYSGGNGDSDDLRWEPVLDWEPALDWVSLESDEKDKEVDQELVLH